MLALFWKEKTSRVCSREPAGAPDKVITSQALGTMIFSEVYLKEACRPPSRVKSETKPWTRWFPRLEATDRCFSKRWFSLVKMMFSLLTSDSLTEILLTVKIITDRIITLTQKDNIITLKDDLLNTFWYRSRTCFFSQCSQ